MPNELPSKVVETLATQNKRSVYIVLSPTGDGNTFKLNADDYDTETKDLANAMAVGTIQESNNQYKVATERTEITLTRENGYPIGISDEAPGGDGNAFLQRETVGTGTRGGRSYFVDISDSGFLNLQVIKGKTDAANDRTKNYDDLLAEVNRDNNSSTLLGGNVIAAQDVRNTYSELHKFLPEDVIEQDSNVGKNAVQLNLGSYVKVSRTNQQATGNPSAEGNFQLTQDILKSLGFQITLKGSGEYYVPKTLTDEGEILLARAAALAPSLARLGLPVPFNAMQAGNVLSEINPNFPNTNLPSIIEEDEKQSFGSTNNWLVLFDGFETQFTLPAIAIQLGAVAAIIAGAAEIYDSRNADLIRAGFLEYFGIEYSGDPGNSAVFAAAIAEAAALGAAAAVPGVSFFVRTPLIQGTGWYTVTLRKIIKIILKSTYGVAANFAGNFESNNLVGTLGATVGAINEGVNAFGLSTLLGIFKSLGAVAKRTSGTYAGLPVTSRGSINASKAYKPNMRSYIDSHTDNIPGDETRINVKSLIKKDRLSRLYNLTTAGGKNPLAWGVSTTPSQYLLPSNIKLAAANLNGSDPNAIMGELNELGPTSKKEVIEVQDGRIKQTLVHELEAQLESSYMPFYFHDLRTNEIVSFHAFLESSKDGFNAEWNSVSSYGRTEPIQIYKGTTRDIQISFYIVATNEKDHDNMWWKINKLVTMVYPQYTKGRTITTNEGKTFVQPFSQLPGSSPIIRVRLGDVWKSNYSKFNVARLFGLTESDFNIDPAAEDPTLTDTYRSLREQTVTWRDNLLQFMNNGVFREGDEFILNYNQGILNIPGPSGDAGGSYVFGKLLVGKSWLGAPRNLVDGEYHLRVKRVLVGYSESRLYTEYAVEILNGPVGYSSTETEAGGTETEEYIIRARNTLQYPPEAVARARESESEFGRASEVLGNELTIFAEEDVQIYESCADLNFSTNEDYIAAKLTEYVNDLVQRTDSQATQQRELQDRRAVAIRRFFSSDGSDPNPIMQSFESTSGKGLAVAFKNLDIDWSGATWETKWNSSRSNSRAPMWVKLSMAGSVIHDISPGLDYNGFNRAPVYQIGSYSNTLNNINIEDTSDRAAADAATEDIGTESISGGPRMR